MFTRWEVSSTQIEGTPLADCCGVGAVEQTPEAEHAEGGSGSACGVGFGVGQPTNGAFVLETCGAEWTQSTELHVSRRLSGLACQTLDAPPRQR